MEFEMKHRLPSSQEVTVLVDAAGEDCLISLTLPAGSGPWLQTVVFEAYLDLDKMEQAAWEEYLVRLKENHEARA